MLARSKRRGRQVAATIFAWSAGDGGHEGYLRNFPPLRTSGRARPLGADATGIQPRTSAVLGGEPDVRHGRWRAVSPGDHPPYSEQAWSLFRGEAEEVYTAVNSLTPSTRRSPASGRMTRGRPQPLPLFDLDHHEVLREERSTLADAVEAYARVGIAVSDAFVACWFQNTATTCSAQSPTFAL